MCESSCASTPSTSFGSSRFQRPVVTATAACFWLRPVAKAFGTSLSITATRGLRRSAIAQRRSIMSCSSGAWSRLDDLRARGLQGELVGGEVLDERHRPDDHDHQHDAGVQHVEQRDREQDVEQPQHRAGQQHAQRQARRRDRKPCVSSRIGPLEGEKFLLIVALGVVLTAAVAACGGAVRARGGDRRSPPRRRSSARRGPRTGCSSSARARRSAGAARSPRCCAARWATRSSAAACRAASR